MLQTVEVIHSTDSLPRLEFVSGRRSSETRIVFERPAGVLEANLLEIFDLGAEYLLTIQKRQSESRTVYSSQDLARANAIVHVVHGLALFRQEEIANGQTDLRRITGSLILSRAFFYGMSAKDIAQEVRRDHDMLDKPRTPEVKQMIQDAFSDFRRVTSERYGADEIHSYYGDLLQALGLPENERQPAEVFEAISHVFRAVKPHAKITKLPPPRTNPLQVLYVNK